MSMRTARAVEIFNINFAYFASERIVNGEGQAPVSVDFHTIAIGVTAKKFGVFQPAITAQNIVHTGGCVKVRERQFQRFGPTGRYPADVFAMRRPKAPKAFV
jgi:hypothetical protein